MTKWDRKLKPQIKNWWIQKANGSMKLSPNTEIFFLIILVKIKIYVEIGYYDFLFKFIIQQTFCIPEPTHASSDRKTRVRRNTKLQLNLEIRGVLIATRDGQEIPSSRRESRVQTTDVRKVLIAVKFQHPCVEERAVPMWLLCRQSIKAPHFSPTACHADLHHLSLPVGFLSTSIGGEQTLGE